MKGKNKAAQQLGRKGGKTTAKKYGKDHFRMAQQKSVASRKQKKLNS